MKFIVTKLEGDKAELQVVEADVMNVCWDDFAGEYTFAEPDEITVVKTVKRVNPAALKEKRGKLATQHDAVDMTDVEAVERVIPEDDEPDELPPEPEVAEEDDEDEDEEEELDEADIDDRLAALGYSEELIAELSIEDKITFALAGTPPKLAEHVHASSTEPREIRGYRLVVWRPTWSKRSNGLPREYEVGETPDHDEVVRVESEWRKAGFSTTIVDLHVHPRAAVAKHTIWDGEPYDPIVCAVPGCSWVGDHLGPHLRKHGFSTADQYSQATGYRGPAVVGRASSALGQAHFAVKARNDLRAGSLVVEIISTGEVVTWRIKSAPTPNGIMLQRLSDSSELLVKYDDLFKKFRPVTLWARRVMRQFGYEIRPARRIQRRRAG